MPSDPTMAPESISGDPTIVGNLGLERAGEHPIGRGDAIGRYVVLSRLGAGGMGVVYAAYDPELDRKVAIKLLLPDAHGSTSGPDGESRLVREAQALARLSHPNVITVHDVGTVDGSVFVAMEFIDGVTWTEWSLTERPWREIIPVALAAGRGIAAAHSVGIIHRDFKPDNVMIGHDGRVRVLDFGLARPAGQADPEARIPAAALGNDSMSSSFDSKLTKTGAMMGTPAYMAPEQHLGGEVDARTDQFAFCVSVFEALYGERPFAGESLAAIAFQAAQGKVRDPPKGSKVPAWLRRELIRGLSPKPEGRHASLEALLDALARDPARTRQRVALGLALTVVVAAAGAAVQRMGAEPSVCETTRNQLEGVWDRQTARDVEEAFAATGVPFAAGAFAAVDEHLSAYAETWVASRTDACEATRVRGGQSDAILTMRNVCLDRRRQQMQALVDIWRIADAAAIERSLDAVQSLSPVGACDDTEALSLGVRPPEDPELRAQVVRLQETIDATNAMLQSGQPTPALALLETIGEEVGSVDYRPLRAEYLLLQGKLLREAKDRIPVLEQAVWMAEAGRHDRVAAEAWTELVGAHASGASDFAAADRAVQRAHAAIERIGTDEELEVRLLVAEGQFLTLAEQPERAVELLRLARQKRVEAGQEASPIALAELVALSNAMVNVDELEEPGRLLEAAIPAAIAQLGDDHPWVARLWATLGRVQYRLEQPEQARDSLARAIEISDRAYGPDSPLAASCLNGLALALEDLGRVDEALAAYQRSLAIMNAELGEQHLNSTKISGNVARLESHLGHHKEAIARQERALARKREIYADENLEIAYALDNLGSFQRQAGLHDASLRSYRQAVQIIERIEGPDGHDLVYSLTGVGQALLALGHAKQGRQQLERAMALMQLHDAKLATVPRADTKFAYARALWETDTDPIRARALATEARDAYAGSSAFYRPRRDEAETWLAEHTIRP